MGKFRKFYDKYERIFLIGLVIFVLIIFTVTADIENWIRSLGEDTYDPSEVAGSFALLPGDKTEISYGEYERARVSYTRTMSVFQRGAGDRVQPSEVWTHLLLLKAARKEGISVSNGELGTFLRAVLPPELFNNKPRYKAWIKERLYTSPRDFEEGIRDFMTAQRVRDVYAQSFMIAPPATRESMVKQYAGTNTEFAKLSWVRLPAAKFLDAARKELKAADKPDDELKAFFEKDASVKADRYRFRHSKRYTIEMLVGSHRKLDEAGLERVKKVFSATWPELDMSVIEPTVGKMREYFGYYQDRLLALAGTTIEEVGTGEPDEPKKEEPKKDEEPKKVGDGDEPKDPKKEGEEPKDPKDEEKEGDKDEEKKEPKKELTQAQRDLRFNRAFAIVKDQVERELELRGMFWHMQSLAAKDPKKSLKEVFDLLLKHDDKDNPICSTEADKGIIQFRRFTQKVTEKGETKEVDKPLTGDEVKAIKVHGDSLTHNGLERFKNIAKQTTLPAVSEKPETAGGAAHMRLIGRLISVEAARKKTFDELTDDEKGELREDFFLPANARERAKARLEELKKKCESGEVALVDFAKAGKSIGGGVIENEWLLASSSFSTEPVRGLYWEGEFEHMRDRHYLKRAVATVLATDRLGKKYSAGKYLPVQVDAREDGKDPGSAYLVLLIERKKPDADTMPLEEFDAFVQISRRQQRAREQERWTRDWPTLTRNFEMEFYGDMQDRIEEELKKRADADKRRIPGR